MKLSDKVNIWGVRFLVALFAIVNGVLAVLAATSSRPYEDKVFYTGIPTILLVSALLWLEREIRSFKRGIK